MFDELREKYPEFIYDSYEVVENDIEYVVTYKYVLNELVFNPKLIIKKSWITNKNIDKEFLDYLFFQYGLFDLINYYKLTCSSKIIIKPMYIDDRQVDFFRKLIFNGLGEYFYINKIDVNYEDFVEFDVVGTKKYEIRTLEGNFKGHLIPVGGGKDSIVTMELLKSYKDENSFFMFERNLYPKNKAGYESIYTGDYSDDEICVIESQLDLQILDLSKKGYLNGHVPFSAFLSMLSFIAAYLTNKRYVVLSNEDSANEGNIKGLNINHQYSKSYEYEEDFRNYTSNYLTTQIEYFSLLRPWNEFRIIKEFLKHRQYLSVFRSCNRGTKENNWCNHCSKCLYVYIMLYPYLTKEELDLVFDNNLLDDKSLEKDFIGLVSYDFDKPFECVGEKKEVNYSLQQALKIKDGELPYLLELYKDKYCRNEISSVEVEEYFNPINFVPEEYIDLLR